MTVCGPALFPMWWGPLSDRHGRRAVLLVGFAIFCAAGAFSAYAGHSLPHERKRGLSIVPVSRYAWNVELLIGGRVFQSLGLSAAGVVGAGSLADVYPPAIRGNAMVRAIRYDSHSSGDTSQPGFEFDTQGWYSAMALTGAVVGPALGGTHPVTMPALSPFGPVVCMTWPRAPAVRRIRGSVLRLARNLRVYGRRGWPTYDPCTGHLPCEHSVSDSNICDAFRCILVYTTCCADGVLPARNAANIRTSALGQPNSRPQALP